MLKNRKFIRIVSALCAAIIAITLPCAVPASAANRLKGDVNNDGKINVKDATEIQRYVAKVKTLDDESKIAADVNFDGIIDVSDAADIQSYIVNIITGFNGLKDTIWTSLDMASEKNIRFQTSSPQANVKLTVPEAAKSWLTAEPNISNGAVKEIKLTTKNYTKKGIVRSATVTINLEGKKHEVSVKQLPKGENNYSYTAYDSDCKTIVWNVPSKAKASALQGMAVSSQYIYTAKVKNSNEAATIYKTDTKASSKTAVPLTYNGNTLVYSCLGHANDMEVVSYNNNNGYATLLVATASSKGIALVDVDNRDAVNEIKKIRNIYPCYIDKDGKSLYIKPTGIAIKASTGSGTDLFIKEGKQIYKGHIDSNIATNSNVVFTEAFKLDRATGDVVKEYDPKLGKYVTRRFTAQGITYRNGSLYAVFACCDAKDNSYYNLSEVLRYDSVDEATNNKEVTYCECFRIQSDTFEFFEMEACGFLDGVLYFNATRERDVKNFTDKEDGILYFNNLNFNSK